jgi:hypothetical protein
MDQEYFKLKMGQKGVGGGGDRGGGGRFQPPNKRGLTFIACVDDGDSAYP